MVPARIGPSSPALRHRDSCEDPGLLDWSRRHEKRANWLGLGPPCSLCSTCLPRSALPPAPPTHTASQRTAADTPW